MAACSVCNTRCLTTIRLVYTYSFWKKPLFSVTQYTIFIYFWHKFYRKHQSSIANNHSSTVFEKKNKNKQTKRKRKKKEKKINTLLPRKKCRYSYIVGLVRIFRHSDWIRRDTPYLSVFCPNAGKYGPKKLRIRTLFTQCAEILYKS